MTSAFLVGQGARFASHLTSAVALTLGLILALAGCGTLTSGNAAAPTGDAQVGADNGAAAADGTVADTTAADASGQDAAIADTQVSDAVFSDASTSDVQAADAAPSDSAAAAPLPIDQFEAAFVDAICGVMITCGGNTFATTAGCKAFLNSQMDEKDGPAQMVALVKAGTLTYDPKAAGECLALYKNCGVMQLKKAPAACAKVFTGSVADGASCTRDEVCKSAFCDHSTALSGACPGKCKAKGVAGAACTASDGCSGDLLCIADKCTAPGGKAGDACVETSCGAGLYCSTGDGVSLCKALVSAGGECDDPKGCQPGLFCGANAAGNALVCQVPAKVGAPCASSGSGSGFGSDAFGASPSPCEGGGVCASTGSGTGICLAPAKLGGPCTHAQQCGGMDVFCSGLTATTPGTCKALPTKGEACTKPDFTKGIFFTCLLPMVCDETTLKCADPPAVGKPCTFFCGPGLSCEQGVCTAKAKLGESCLQVSCESGLDCLDGKCAKPVCQ